jgi:hypothetical protein
MKCEDGRQLSIDDEVPSTRKGKTAAVRALVPGPHTVRVDGTVAGKVLQAEIAFNVAAGRTEEVSLTLA